MWLKQKVQETKYVGGSKRWLSSGKPSEVSRVEKWYDAGDILEQLVW